LVWTSIKTRQDMNHPAQLCLLLMLF